LVEKRTTEPSDADCWLGWMVALAAAAVRVTRGAADADADALVDVCSARTRVPEIRGMVDLVESAVRKTKVKSKSGGA
jgi:hypothetical protein